MKIVQLLISLLLWRASISSSSFALAQEEQAPSEGAIDAPSEEQVEAPVDVEVTTPAVEEIPPPNCDEICAEKLDAAASIASSEREKLQSQVNKLQEGLRQAEQRLLEANRKNDDIAVKLQREIDEISASRKECLETVGSLKLQIAQVKSSFAATSEESAKLAGDLFLVKQELTAYEEKTFYLNTDLLLAEVKKVIKYIKGKVQLVLSKTGIKK